jgi:hypothetical protein
MTDESLAIPMIMVVARLHYIEVGDECQLEPTAQGFCRVRRCEGESGKADMGAGAVWPDR